MKTYGPTFAIELIAAGVGGLPFVWNADGDFVFDDSVTPEQRTIIQNVADAHNSSKTIMLAISPKQIRMALNRTGLRTKIENAVSIGDQDLKDWWEFSLSFERSHPQVTAMGIAIGQTDAQLDEIWTLGASL
jgi:hypothetical protein